MLRFGVLAGALLAAAAERAEPVVFEAVERGSFREGGSYALGPDAEYAAGRGEWGEARSVFVFDASVLEGAATSATLRIWSPGGPTRAERVVAYGVSADPAALVWDFTLDLNGFETEPARGTFWDLGTGRALGTARVPAGFAGFVEIPLDAAILRVLDRTDGRVAFGVRVASPRGQVFDGTGPGSEVPRPQLVVETDAAAGPGPARLLHVDAARKGARETGSLETPFRSIAAALDLAAPGDTVRVAPGRYPESLLLKHGVDVIGSGADRTILDLGTRLPSVRCAEATLKGIFVWREDVPVRPTVFRSALDCSNGASPLVSEARIAATVRAVLLEGSNATLSRNQIGGTIQGVDASPQLLENETEGIALSFGSGESGSFRIERNRIRGTVLLEGVAPEGNEIVGNLFLPAPLTGIPAGSSGGIFASAVGDLGLIASNTFFRTQGIRLCEPPALDPFPFPIPGRDPKPCADREQGATAIIANNILAFGRLGILLDSASDATIAHNDVFQNDAPFGLGPIGNYVGLADLTGSDGNISENPLFEGSAYEDAELAAGSAAVDAGANDLAATDFDLDGDPRIADGAIDLGAQERQPGETSARWVQVLAEGSTRANVLGLGGFLAPKRSFRVSIRSDAELDAPAEVDVDSLALEGFAPLGRGASRCRARDADEDGDADLVCRFPFEALAGLSGLVTKRFCLAGETSDGSPLRGCSRVNVLLLPPGQLR